MVRKRGPFSIALTPLLSFGVGKPMESADPIRHRGQCLGDGLSLPQLYGDDGDLEKSNLALSKQVEPD